MRNTVNIPIVEFEAFRRGTREHRVAAYVRALVRAGILYQWDKVNHAPMTSGDDLFKPKNQKEKILWEKSIKLAKKGGY